MTPVVSRGGEVAYWDLRELIKQLEKAGGLKRISAGVDPMLKNAEIADRVTKAGGTCGRKARIAWAGIVADESKW